MSDLLPLKKQITYGPVKSRRLGRSLGINLLPPAQKWCTYDCLYCQYGWTPVNNGGSQAERYLPKIEDVVNAVEAALQNLNEPPAYLTFSGNGEPTLHPDFFCIVKAIHSLRDRVTPASRIALLSNASRIGEPAIRSAVSLVDCPILKFDAGNDAVFHSFNRPIAGVDYDDIVAGLSEMRNITLQSLFAAGPAGNIDEEHIADWCARIRRIRPRSVQIYTLSRAVPCNSLAPAPPAALLDIRSRLDQDGVTAEVF